MSLGTLRVAVHPLLKSLATTSKKLFSPKLLLYTNTSLTVSLSITGDILQQWYQAKTKRKDVGWDKLRTLRMAGTGLLIGPLVHFWYIFLDRWLPGRTFGTLCKKIALDQLVCSPFYVSLFILSLGVMEKKNWADIKKDFADKGSVLYVAEWVVWPPAQVFNFYFLPTRYRVLYDNSISMVFDTFWSYVWYEMGCDTDGETDTIGHLEYHDLKQTENMCNFSTADHLTQETKYSKELSSVKNNKSHETC
ncbi:mpv17-like protein 2 [Littorina saxatilis]|uniref:Mpv17-like protein 2 n=1 Tax=Littorina saxatilis TaxID=31220 RepID=A0AAN9GN17_9CAEN